MHIFASGYEGALHMNDAVLPELIFQLLGENIVIVLLAIAIISAVVLGVRIVPQSENMWLNVLVDCTAFWARVSI
jgi:hypothetical protein